MHEMLATVTFYLVEGNTPTVPSTTDTSSLKIAIITTIGVIMAAAITAAATTLQRRRDQGPVEGTQDLIAELQRRAAMAEAQASACSEKADLLSKRVDELEEYCWQNGIDPRTGNAIERHGIPGRENNGTAPTS